jgi:1,4-alpha-glucan branching enzyme
MGANLAPGGATFRVWAPRALRVHLVSQLSEWKPKTSNILTRDANGCWVGFWPGFQDGAPYKFYVFGPGGDGYKRDPYARELSNQPAWPNANCIVRDPRRYPWHDAAYRTPHFHNLVLYQLHIGAFWSPQSGQQSGKFLDVINRLPYLSDLGITAIQLLPIVEFQTAFSLGYNGTDYFSPENDYECSPSEIAARLPAINTLLAAQGQPPLTAADLDGSSNQLRCLIDLAHLHGLAVIFDVVYNHAGGDFGDESLYFFDQMPRGNNNDSLYFSDVGHAGGLCFALWQQEVRQFLIDNAKALFEEYHVDGLRHDQVSVLVGANPNDGWRFCQDLNGTCHFLHPGGLQHAEYWGVDPYVVKSAGEGGAGFDTCYHDALRDAVRSALAQASSGANAPVNMTAIAQALWPAGFDQSWKVVQNLETHDEVLEGRKPRIAQLADPANSRSWYARSRARVAAGLLLTAPGTPMLFMGQEFLEDKPWSDNVQDRSNLRLYWDGLEKAPGAGGDRHMSDYHRCVRDLIRLRHQHPALRGEGFRVFHMHNANRVLAFHRWWPGEGQDIVIIANLSEHTYSSYQLGFPRSGRWAEAFNSDVYDHWVNPWVQGNGGAIFAHSAGQHGFAQSANVTIPANSLLVFA